MLVIVLLAALLTFGGGSVTVGGREVNNFLRLDNLVPNVATTMSWMAIMAVGVTLVIVGGGHRHFGRVDLRTGGAGHGGGAAGASPKTPRAWSVLPVAVAVAAGHRADVRADQRRIVVGLRMHPFIVTLGTLSIFRGIALISVPTKSLPCGRPGRCPRRSPRRFMSWQFTLHAGRCGPAPAPAGADARSCCCAWRRRGCF